MAQETVRQTIDTIKSADSMKAVKVALGLITKILENENFTKNFNDYSCCSCS